MSDPQSPTNSTPAAPASPVIDLPNTVIHADPAPAAAAPDPVPPAAPELPTDYRISTLENGQQEVVLNSGQTYRGTPEQVINELAKAQYHASRRITELGQQIPPAPVQTGPQIDPTAKAIADLNAQGLGYPNAEAYLADLRSVQTGVQQQQINNLSAQFVAQNPDFPATPENGEKIDALLTQLGIPPSLEAWQVAHNHLKATGQYIKTAPPIQQPRPAGMPMPPNGQAGIPQGQPTEAEMWAMPFAEFEQKFRTQV